MCFSARGHFLSRFKEFHLGIMRYDLLKVINPFLKFNGPYPYLNGHPCGSYPESTSGRFVPNEKQESMQNTNHFFTVNHLFTLFVVFFFFFLFHYESRAKAIRWVDCYLSQMKSFAILEIFTLIFFSQSACTSGAYYFM